MPELDSLYAKLRGEEEEEASPVESLYARLRGDVGAGLAAAGAVPTADIEAAYGEPLPSIGNAPPSPVATYEDAKALPGDLIAGKIRDNPFTSQTIDAMRNAGVVAERFFVGGLRDATYLGNLIPTQMAVNAATKALTGRDLAAERTAAVDSMVAESQAEMLSLGSSAEGAATADFVFGEAMSPMDLIGAKSLGLLGRALNKVSGAGKAAPAVGEETAKFLAKYNASIEDALDQGDQVATWLRGIQRNPKQVMVSRTAPIEGLSTELDLLLRRQRGAAAIAKTPITSYTFRFDPERLSSVPVGRSLEQRIGGLTRAQADELDAYMAARRNLDLADRSKQQRARKVLAERKGEEFNEALIEVSDESVQDSKRLLQSQADRGLTPELRELTDDLVAWEREAILDPLRDVGVLSDDVYQLIVDNGANYTPFLRAFREIDETIQPITRGLGTEEELLRIPGIEAMVQKAQKVQLFVEQQRLRNGLVNFLEENEELASRFNIGRAGKLDSLRGKNVIHRWVDGEKEAWKVGEELAWALDLHTPGSLNMSLRSLDYNPAWKGLQMGGRLLRTGATQTPAFSAFNFMRDAAQTAVYSKYGYHPVDALRGLFEAFNKGDLYKEWASQGGEIVARTSVDRPNAALTARDILESKTIPDKMKRFWEHWKREGWLYPMQAWVTEPFENANRLGQFMKVRRRAAAGKGKAVLPSIDEAAKEALRTRSLKSAKAKYREARRRTATMAEAVEESRENSLDFQRQGTWSGQWNQAEAFFQASLLDVDRFMKAMREQPITTTLKGIGLLTIPKLAEFIRFHDDPMWQNREEWLHAGTIAVAKRENGGFVSMPMPIGMPALTFGYTIPKALAMLYAEDPNARAEIAEQIFEKTPLQYTRAPDIFPSAIQPTVEGYANYSSFRDRPIEPRTMQELRPEERYFETTSPTVVAAAQAASPFAGMPGVRDDQRAAELIPVLSSATGGSPLKMEELFLQSTGSLGRAALTFTDVALRAAGVFDDTVRRPLTVSRDMPLLRRLLEDPQVGPGSRPVTEFWEIANKINTEKKTFDHVLETRGELLDQSPRQQALMALWDANQAAREQMRNIINARQSIFAGDPRVLSEEEMEGLYQMDALMSMLAATNVKLYRDFVREWGEVGEEQISRPRRSR